ncbi:MAG: Hint domain-containing protein [Methylorubrum rhodinum]|uniref:Hint domain-containing protein n=1 Tax=Methylorubrum rhodinum TaxID=29428 RepID=UPI003BB1A231
MDGNNETPAACYVTGTRILTARGSVAVEDLAVGDLAVTASGEERPVRWIGHQTVRCRGRAAFLPVRIAAGAFGEGRPARNLMVSPGHTVCVDVLGEVLIPAIRLVNGTTVAQVPVEKVTYWHVELESHDILLAEGLPAESYLDMGNRAFFEGASIGIEPDAPVGHNASDFCRPFLEAGPLVEAVRTRLEDRAVALGWRKVEEAFASLHAVADGHMIRPDVDGLTARFVIPAEAHNVRLVSATSVPAQVLSDTSDDRQLGVALASLVIDDGLTGARRVALDDTRLSEGFHPVDRDGEASWRWTNGEAVLPASLWDGCRGTLFLRVRLSGPALPRWIAPDETAGVVDLDMFRQQA